MRVAPLIELKLLTDLKIKTIIVNGHEDEAKVLRWLSGCIVKRIKIGVYECI